MATYWALDLGEAEIAAVRMAVEEGPPRVLDFAFAPIASGGTGRGPAETRQALYDLARRLHLRRAVVHVAGAGTATVLRDEVLSAEDLDGTPETVRRHLLDLLPGDIETREVRYESHARDDDSVGYRLLSVPRESVERTVALLAGAELRRAALHSGAIGLAEGVERLPPGDRPFALLRIGSRVTILSVHESGRIERYRIPTGEEDLAAAVSARLSVSTEEAYRRLAAGTGDPDAARTASALSKPLERLGSDIVRLLEYHGTRPDACPPETLYPVGSVATRPPVTAGISGSLNLPVVALPAPGESLLPRSERAARDGFDDAYPRLVGAIGVGLLATRSTQDPLTLRPLPPAPQIYRMRSHLTAAGLLIALTVGLWATESRELGRLRELDGRQRRLATELPTPTHSPAQVTRDRRLVADRLALLEDKVRTRRALRAVDALFPAPREGESYLLESLRYDGERVEAVLLVRVPRGTDAAAAAETIRTEVPERLRRMAGSGGIPRVEVLPWGYRLHASWQAGEP